MSAFEARAEEHVPTIEQLRERCVEIEDLLLLVIDLAAAMPPIPEQRRLRCLASTLQQRTAGLAAFADGVIFGLSDPVVLFPAQRRLSSS